MLHTLLRDIEAIRSTRLQAVTRNARGQLQIEDPPPANAAGFYWIYTDYRLRFIKRKRAVPCAGAADISFLAKCHADLAGTCTIEDAGFRIVYAGRAGSGLGVRGRVHQHFNGGAGTGALAILRTNLSNLARWRVSCVTIEAAEPNEADVPAEYRTVGDDLERMWKIEYGWPILCIR